MIQILSDSRVLYTLLILAVALERAGELLLSRRNLRKALARGGVTAGDSAYRRMALFHAAFLLACPAEVWLLHRPWRPLLGYAMLATTALAMAIRYWAVRALGDHWNVRVVCIPGAPAVKAGPYRYLRHPNYLAVALELFALPLVHGAWLTALVFGTLNLAVLRERIRTEEDLLSEHTDYAAAFTRNAPPLTRSP